jgi:hypothetical protein
VGSAEAHHPSNGHRGGSDQDRVGRVVVARHEGTKHLAGSRAARHEGADEGSRGHDVTGSIRWLGRRLLTVHSPQSTVHSPQFLAAAFIVRSGRAEGGLPGTQHTC